MNENDHERRSEDVAAFVLGALEPGEAAELERHLEGCERLPGPSCAGCARRCERCPRRSSGSSRRRSCASG